MMNKRKAVACFYIGNLAALSLLTNVTCTLSNRAFISEQILFTLTIATYVSTYSVVIRLIH